MAIAGMDLSGVRGDEEDEAGANRSGLRRRFGLHRDHDDANRRLIRSALRGVVAEPGRRFSVEGGAVTRREPTVRRLAQRGWMSVGARVREMSNRVQTNWSRHSEGVTGGVR
jgi:hypothetical protein